MGDWKEDEECWEGGLIVIFVSCSLPGVQGAIDSFIA